MLDDWSEDEFTKLPLLTSEQGLELVNWIAPKLRSVHITRQCGQKLAFQIGKTGYFQVNDLDYSMLYEIILNKSFNLEEANFNVQHSCAIRDCPIKNGEDIPFVEAEFLHQFLRVHLNKLRALTLAMVGGLFEVFPEGVPALCSLQEITLIGPAACITLPNFSAISNALTVIDIKEVPIFFEDLY